LLMRLPALLVWGVCDKKLLTATPPMANAFTYSQQSLRSERPHQSLFKLFIRD
jgi:hypothetical protein